MPVGLSLVICALTLRINDMDVYSTYSQETLFFICSAKINIITCSPLFELMCCDCRDTPAYQNTVCSLAMTFSQ
jgi:hypothetical protein